MSTEFRLPELGENITEAEVAEVLVQEGDEIEAEQPVMELETEKAVIELPAPHAGRVEKVHVSNGDTIKVGAVVLTIAEASEEGKKEESEEEPEEKDEEENKAGKKSKDKKKEKPRKAEKEEAEEEPKEEQAEEKRPQKKKDKGKKPEQKRQPAKEEHQPQPAERADEQEPPPPAGPATRRFARKLGVDLRQVSGTGDGGRITQEDVEAFVSARLRSAPPAGTVKAEPKLPDFSQFGPVERQRLSKLRRTAARQLSTSWQVIPHVTQHDLADVTELESIRRRYMQTLEKDSPKITVTAVVLKACAQLLSEMPQFNSSFDAAAGELVLKRYYHIGVAVDTEYGLVVPVIRDADEKSIQEIAAELSELSEQARSRKLELEQMQGASFTITNLGGIGGTYFTPIVNHPEVAILGLSRSQPQPALVEGKLEQRLMLPLSLSYDHRVINGADAARFIVRLSSLLAQPFGLLANI